MVFVVYEKYYKYLGIMEIMLYRLISSLISFSVVILPGPRTFPSTIADRQRINKILRRPN